MIDSFFSSCSEPPWKHDLQVVFLALWYSRLTAFVFTPSWPGQ